MVAVLMLPVGLAGPLVLPPITALLLNSVPDGVAGTASGVFNTSRQLGGALAIAVFGALLAQPAGLAHGVRGTSLAIAAAVAHPSPPPPAASSPHRQTTTNRGRPRSSAVEMCAAGSAV